MKLKDLIKESWMKDWNTPPEEKRWSKRWNENSNKSGLTQFERKGGKDYIKKDLKEYNREYSELEKYETAIFDVIIQFKKIYERSPHKKNRKINKHIQDLLKIESKLGDEVTELE
jgi:hypothetical protein